MITLDIFCYFPNATENIIGTDKFKRLFESSTDANFVILIGAILVATNDEFEKTKRH